VNRIKKLNIIIAGAAGRDYNNFLRYFKDNPMYNVVCFTATQIPGIEKRTFPKKLAGKLYNKDIPIYAEKFLPDLIKKHNIDYVYLSYSDLSHQYVMEFASKVLAAGTNFALLGTKDTYIKSKRPVISVTAIRTGCGKSQTSRKIAELLTQAGKKVGLARHPMPYGDLVKQEVQKFCNDNDFKIQKATIEEQEEYTPYTDEGLCIYAGVDYEKILRIAEKDNEIIIWDGGNNDFEFFEPDLKFVVTDPHRAGHELTYYPGFINFLTADYIIINKIDSAKKEDIKLIEDHAKKYNPKAKIIKARSKIIVDKSELIKNKRCLVVGDGPTLTHGNMSFGAGTLAAKKYNGKIIDPRQFTSGSLKELFNKFPHLHNELPAMGYDKKQMKELENTINKAKCDVVIDGTPANLEKQLKINKPIVSVKYDLDEIGDLNLKKALSKYLR